MSKYNPLIEYLHDLPNDIYNEVVKLLIKEILRKQKDDNDLILFMNDIDVNEFILFNDIIEFKNYLNEHVGIVIEYKKDKRIEINLRDYYTIIIIQSNLITMIVKRTDIYFLRILMIIKR